MLSPEDHCFPSKALQSHWRGGVGKARGPPAKGQREEGVGVARVGKKNWEGWQMRLVKTGGERKFQDFRNSRLVKPSYHGSLQDQFRNKQHRKRWSPLESIPFEDYRKDVKKKSHCRRSFLGHAELPSLKSDLYLATPGLPTWH